MSKKKVSEIVEQILGKYMIDNNYELVDVEFVKEGAHRYLRIYADKEGGITLDDCQNISQYLSAILDDQDPIKENYFLEVSSPGLERPLKKDSDFEKYKGRKVEAKLFQPINGQKLIMGELEGLKENIVFINENDSIIEIPKDKIALIKLVVEF
jgi:ribosome maturation factor RimP